MSVQGSFKFLHEIGNNNNTDLQNVPCKLYFDLEFKKKLNPKIDSASLMQKFKARLISHLKETFGIILTESNILDLDSSTEEKFSRHVIVDLIFKDNFHVGNYVRAFCSKFQEDKDVRVQVTEKEGGVGIFVDQGVYTKNRNFRLFLSSKYGKIAILNFSKSDNSDNWSKCSNKQIFLSSLLTFNPDKRKPLDFGPDSSNSSFRCQFH